jgi:hypothetical protein
MALQIPREGRKSLAELLAASPEFLDAFYVALSECEPKLLPSDTSELLSRLSKFPEVDGKMIAGFLRLINGALNSIDELPAEKAVADLIAGAQATPDKELNSKAAGWGRVRDFLTKAFALDKLRMSARALGLYYDTPRHMQGTRILTDARPVFPRRADEDPAGFVIIHTMRVDYFENNQAKDWYVSLDSDDLKVLKEAVDRAIEKQNTLQRFLKKASAVVLTPYEGSDEATS